MYLGNSDIEDATLFSDSVELSGSLSINTELSTSTLTFPSTQGSSGQVLTVSSTTSVLYFTDATTNTDSQTISGSLSGNNLNLWNQGTTSSATVDLSAIANTDTQTLSISGQVISLTGGGSVTVPSNTDSQTISGSLSGNNLNLWNQGTTSSATVDLSAIANTDTQTLSISGQVISLTGGGSVTVPSNTDSQTISGSLSGNNLNLWNQGTTSSATVDLSAIANTDTQTLSISGQVISLTGGGSVTVPSNTDSQTISGSLSGNNLNLWNQGTTSSATVDLSAIANTDTQTLSISGQVISLTGGGSVTVPSNTDSQTISGSLSGNNLNLWNQGTTSSATVDLSAIANTDTQTLSISGQVISLTGGGSVTVPSNTDSQTISGSLSGNNLNLWNQGTTSSATVDLSAIANTDTQTLSISGQVISLTGGGSVTVPSNTDSQTISGSLSGNNLNLWNQGTTSSATVDLSAIANTDTQTLSISGQVISLTGGGSVTVPSNTDSQTISGSLSGNNLNLWNQGTTSSATVDLSAIANTDTQTLAQVTAQGSQTTDSIQVGGIFDLGILVVNGESSLQGDVNLGDATSDTVSYNGKVNTSIYFDNTSYEIGDATNALNNIFSQNVKSSTSNDLYLDTNDTGDQVVFANNGTAKAGVNSTTLYIGDYGTSDYYLFPTTRGSAGQVLTVSTTTSELIFTDATSNTDTQTLAQVTAQGTITTDSIQVAGLTVSGTTGLTVGEAGNQYTFPTTRGTSAQVLTVSSTTSELVFSTLATLPTATNEGAVLRWNGGTSVWEETTDLRIAPGGSFNPTDAIWIDQEILPTTNTLTLGNSTDGFDKVFSDYFISSQNSITLGTNGSNYIYLKFEGDSNGSMVLNDKTTNGSGSFNTVFGYRNLKTTGTGDYNVAIGFEVLNNGSSGTGSNNTAVGYSALSYNTGDENVAIGANAFEQNTGGTQGVAVGRQALDANTTGSYNVGIGYDALTANTTGENNVAIGKSALATNLTGDSNIAIGSDADVASNNLDNAIALGANASVSTSNTIRLGDTAMESIVTSATLQLDAVTYPNTTGTSGQVLTVSSTTGILYFADASSGGLTPVLQEDNSIYIMEDPSATTSTAERNTALGYDSLESITTGDENVAIGNNVLGEINTGSGNVAVGKNLFDDQTNNTNNVIIGQDIGDRLKLATDNSTNILIGKEILDYGTARAASSVGFNVAIGFKAMYRSNNSSNNVVIGNYAMGTNYNDTRSIYSVAIGNNALSVVNNGDYNTAVGSSAGVRVSAGRENAFFGYSAGRNVTNGDENVAMGLQALGGNNSGYVGDGNVALGALSLYGLSNSSADQNIAIGYSTMSSLSNGDRNIALGANAGDSNYTGSDNIFIGSPGANASNRIYIGRNLTNYTTYIAGRDNIYLLGPLTVNDGSNTYKFPSTRGTAGQVLTVSTTTSELVFADASSGTDTQTLSDVTSQGTITTDNIQVGGLTVSGTTGLTIGEGGKQYSLPTEKGSRGQSLVVSATTNQLVFASRYYLLAKNSGAVSMANNTGIGGFSVAVGSGITITTSGTASVFNLPSNRVYELTGHINLSDNDEVEYQFYDGSNLYGVVGQSGGVMDQDKDGGSLNDPMGYTSPAKAIIDTLSGSLQIILRVDDTREGSKPDTTGTYVMIKEL